MTRLVTIGGTPIYAIIETGGKQYRVAQGDVVEVEKLPAEEGSTVELDRVLLLADGEKITTGAPTIAGAKVTAKVEAQARLAKIIVFKYKHKARYRRKTGHRQHVTRLSIQQIVAG